MNLRYPIVPVEIPVPTIASTTSACFICIATRHVRIDPTELSSVYVAVARHMLDGMYAIRRTTRISLSPPGTNVVERAARLLEELCKACKHDDCARCAHAAEIRAASERLYRERDEELEPQRKQDAIDRICTSICPTHAEFSRMLLTEFHQREAWKNT
jgi:hypothetical protein